MADFWTLPHLGLLQSNLMGGASIDRDLLISRASEIESTLGSFDVAVTVVEVRPGPLFTAFDLNLGLGVRIAQLKALQPDLARALGESDVSIEPVANTPNVSLLIANPRHGAVPFAELIASRAFEEQPGSLPFVIGKTVAGDPACYDLGSLRHLLIGGTTGSGKSMGVHAILTSLLFATVPDRVRFLLIDPKAVEFAFYDAIPQLLAPVVSETSKAVRALTWLVAQMDARFLLMAKLGVRNLEGYNAKVRRSPPAQVAEEGVPRLGYDGSPPDPAASRNLATVPELLPLPAIIVAIDNLAELMGEAFDELDPLLQRLVQRGHLAGIHLILTTERPSAAIVSGAVKANLASRLAYRVVSAAESRIVLDEAGAEELSRVGDMLFRAAGTRTSRIHGASLTDAELRAVAGHWRDQAEPDFVLDQAMAAQPTSASDRPPLYDQALEIVTRTDNASTSFLQRQLRIGYNEAARLMDELERRGIVGPPDYIGRRSIYHDRGPENAKPVELDNRPHFRWPWSR